MMESNAAYERLSKVQENVRIVHSDCARHADALLAESFRAGYEEARRHCATILNDLACDYGGEAATALCDARNQVLAMQPIAPAPCTAQELRDIRSNIERSLGMRDIGSPTIAPAPKEAREQ